MRLSFVARNSPIWNLDPNAPFGRRLHSWNYWATLIVWRRLFGCRCRGGTGSLSSIARCER